jgi:hypothetical protein
MRWLQSLTVTLLVTSGCELEIGGAALEASGDLCSRACEERSETGCVTNSDDCASTCRVAQDAGICRDELDAHLACQATASHLHCGRAPNGADCDDEGVALEHCLSDHGVGQPPPDCYDDSCWWACYPVGQMLCTPGQRYDCECPSGGLGRSTCSADGCFRSPCECAE